MLKFEDSAVTCFSVMLLTDTQTHKLRVKIDFRIQGTSKCANSSKSSPQNLAQNNTFATFW